MDKMEIALEAHCDRICFSFCLFSGPFLRCDCMTLLKGLLPSCGQEWYYALIFGFLTAKKK